MFCDYNLYLKVTVVKTFLTVIKTDTQANGTKPQLYKANGSSTRPSRRYNREVFPLTSVSLFLITQNGLKLMIRFPKITGVCFPSWLIVFLRNVLFKMDNHIPKHETVLPYAGHRNPLLDVKI